MNTYYEIRLTKTQYNALLMLAETGLADLRKSRTPAIDEAWALLCNAKEHPNIEDVYQYEAEHSGFTAGEKVLLECTVVATSDHVSTLSVRHLAAVKGEEIMVSNKLLYHKD